ncbi:NAD-dependent histone deacetylase [Aureococcus anophagefferens]|nr:NAD-dependent histone deacetylase [Aureococcus anophagefferens]
MAEVPEPPTGAWTCEFCTFLNTKASRVSCEMCRKHRKRPRDAAAAAPPPPAAADAPVNTVGGYAARLSEYANKGVTGLPEAEDSKRVLTSKLSKLADLVKNAKKIAVLTGAGISTSAGIPDFRGPKGIWTLEDEEKKRTKRRKPPRKLRETCETCGREYFRDYDLGGISFQPTGRQCACGGRLLDTVLDWDDGLPDSEWLPATRHFEDADLAITLGTSLRIVPAGELPLTSKNFVIVNLQPTPYDDKAGLVIRARVDGVMAALLEALGLDLPPPPAREAPPAEAAEAEPTAAVEPPANRRRLSSQRPGTGGG